MNPSWLDELSFDVGAVFNHHDAGLMLILVDLSGRKGTFLLLRDRLVVTTLSLDSEHHHWRSAGWRQIA